MRVLLCDVMLCDVTLCDVILCDVMCCVSVLGLLLFFFCSPCEANVMMLYRLLLFFFGSKRRFVRIRCILCELLVMHIF
jgi:hypothetical protein